MLGIPSDRRVGWREDGDRREGRCGGVGPLGWGGGGAESALQRHNQDRDGLAELPHRFSLQQAERTHITPWNYQRTLPRPAAAAPGFFPLGWFWRRIVP